MFTTPAPLLPEIFRLHAKWRSGDSAVICDNEHWTWAQFNAEVTAFAAGTRALGLREQARIGLFMSNDLHMVRAIYGAMLGGYTVVPLNTSVTDAAAIAMLDDASVSMLVVSDDLMARGEQIAQGLSSTPQCVTTGEARGAWMDMDQLCVAGADPLSFTPPAPESIVNIIYSSGTTGLPKGIAHDHRSRRDWAYDLANALRYHGKARTLCTIGLYSNISWVAMLSTLISGGCIVVDRSFDAKRTLDLIREHRITHMAMVPIQFQRLCDAIDSDPSTDVSSLQALMSCGSPLRETLKRRIFDLIPCGVIELYGLTEGIITTLDVEDAEGRWSSVGRPLLGTDICIVDEQGVQLPRGEAGEICSRGRIAMPGYWNRDDANQDATYIDSDGLVWLRSGDIGYVDDEGYLYIVDRKKDMILSGGQNIFPQDLEAVLASHPDVFDCAVIGMASERWGETPVALVCEKSPKSVATDELLRWANDQLGKQQRLADVIVVPELPRNPNGKILKRELREAFKERRYG